MATDRAPPSAKDRGFKLSEVTVLAITAGVAIGVMFFIWGIVEDVATTDEASVRLVHILRGVTSSLVAAGLVFAVGYMRHRRLVAGMEVELSESEADKQRYEVLLQTIVENAPAGLIVLDEDLVIQQANRMAERVHRASLHGRSCAASVGRNSPRCAECPARDVIATGQAHVGDYQYTDPRSDEVLSVDFHPLELPDGQRLALMVERVVTDQKKLQSRLLHQEKMAAFGLLAAGMAHDLGNPLSAIAMNLELLGDDELPERARGNIRVVRHEVERLQRTLRELVDFARRRRDEESLVSVQRVVEDAIRLLRHDRRMQAVEVAWDADPEAPAVSIIEDHLMQVVLNLLINAMDAMPDGGRLRVAVRAQGESVELAVADTGQGMNAEVLEHCFDPLYTTKPQGHGTGLGLSICRDIVRGAGGEIEAHSTPGKGTRVVMRLPAGRLQAVAVA